MSESPETDYRSEAKQYVFLHLSDKKVKSKFYKKYLLRHSVIIWFSFSNWRLKLKFPVCVVLQVPSPIFVYQKMISAPWDSKTNFFYCTCLHCLYSPVLLFMNQYVSTSASFHSAPPTVCSCSLCSLIGFALNN